jgi:HEPN domain-containing protein
MLFAGLSGKAELCMKNNEHACALVEMARKNLMAAKAMNDPNVFSDEIVGFHVQQAIEKTLKAWIASRGETYPKTHDIRLLIYHLKEKESFIESYEYLIEYNIFAVQYRYEIYTSTDYPLNRSEACRHAEELVNHVAGLLGM